MEYDLREKYRLMRISGNYDIDWFYEFYSYNIAGIKSKTKELSRMEFLDPRLFNNYFNKNSKFIFKYLDRHFKIDLLLSSDGKIINAY